MPETATEHHQWLKQLVGEWEFRHSAEGFKDDWGGRETARMLGEMWLVAESRGRIPPEHGGGEMQAVLTLGYDTKKGGYVGSWIGSPMSAMFVYEAELDDARRALTMSTRGPSFEDAEKLTDYRDVIELVGDDTRLLRSEGLMADGTWKEYMRGEYTRVG